MEARPEVGGADLQQFASLLGAQAVDFPEQKRIGQTAREPRQASAKTSQNSRVSRSECGSPRQESGMARQCPRHRTRGRRSIVTRILLTPRVRHWSSEDGRQSDASGSRINPGQRNPLMGRLQLIASGSRGRRHESGLLPECESACRLRTMRSVDNGSRRQRRLTQGGTSHARPQSQAGRTDSGAAL